MPTFDIEAETITIFRVGDEYLFSHYFDREDVFDELREYYQREEYRFEIPAEDLEAVQEYLAEEYFELEVVTELEPYCVLTDRFDEHAAILRNSVATWERDGKRFFLMEDELAVAEALERGATRIADTDYVVGL